MNEERRSIGEERYADADPDTIREQIGAALLDEIQARNLITMDDGLMFMFGPTGRAKIRKIIVKLNVRDYYEVEVGYLNARDFGWNIVHQESEIDVDMLADSVRRLAARGLDA
ncbi:hypothetical protein [Amycolatopsis sp. CA-126428]|uniref:hypothetical protein n=1 Tax=Amycolatopsis sp. CA-126428 TaxID=2073158 RepID=UPI000CD21F67|nr:hypothetical protein [Amycolatopsis sp. CA-126428]